jgi:hydroxyacylglutathione hydrolase
MSNVTSSINRQPPLKAAIIPVTPLQQNCTLFWCTETNKGALVDPGGDLDKLKAAVAQTGVELEKLLVTHGHLDHCGQAGMLAKELGLKIEGPQEEDRFWIAQLDEDGPRWGMHAESFEPDRWLEDGDTVTVGNLTLDVIHCPGHTPGHVVFYHGPSPVSGQHRSHGFSARQPCRPDQRDYAEIMAAGRRCNLHPRPRPDQPVRA